MRNAGGELGSNLAIDTEVLLDVLEVRAKAVVVFTCGREGKCVRPLAAEQRRGPARLVG